MIMEFGPGTTEWDQSVSHIRKKLLSIMMEQPMSLCEYAPFIGVSLPSLRKFLRGAKVEPRIVFVIGKFVNKSNLLLK